jgi:peptidyl-prolyl cis-trans isomerase C
MKTAKFLLPLLLVAIAVAGCGGGGGKAAALDANDVAVVDQMHITKPDFDALMQQAKSSFAQQGKAFPKQGTQDYETIKSQAVTLLVQQAEKEAEAKSEGITVTDKQIQARLDQIKKQYFGGSQKKYLAQLKTQKLTDAQVRTDLRHQLYSEKISSKVTGKVSASDADVHAYYLAHKSTYATPQSRDVQYILIKKKALASSIYSQLKAGNKQTWCTLAKKYSQDTSSKSSCGKATFSKGQTVPAFDKVLFSAKTNVIQKPIDTKQYGWFVIMATSAIHPKSTTPEKQVASTIKTTLNSQKKNTALSDWAAGVTKSYCSGSKVKYQVGYTPSPDPCAAVTSTNQTTT